MINPLTLYNFGKSCKDSMMVGNVVRALCKQQVALSSEEKVLYDMIRNDSTWMDERITAERARQAERQRRHREAMTKTCADGMSRNVTDVTVTSVTNRDKTDVTDATVTPPPVTDVTDPSFLPSSLPSSLPPAKANINRSVPVPVGAAKRNGNGNGNGSNRLEDDCRRFVDLVHRNPDECGPFFDAEFSPTTIICSLTGDRRSVRRWNQLAKAIPEGRLREEVFAFYREIRSGDEPKNRAAALNARLGAIADAENAKGGQK